MKRRAFLGNTAATVPVAAAAAAAAGLAGCSPNNRKPAHNGFDTQNSTVLDDNGLIGGKTLSGLRDLYHYDLFDDYLPFHDKYVIDHEYGGFIVSIDRDGTMIAADKYARYLGRGLFTYGYLYNTLDNDPKHLETLHKAVEFTLRHKPSGDNLWPETFSR